jgi:membrane-associated protein
MEKLIPLIETVGYIGVFSMIFAETGLLVGFFLPGDTLLFSAGVLASKGIFNIAILLVGASIMAILGDSIGYLIGKSVGPKIFTREDSVLFKRKYLIRAQEFTQKYGKKTVFLARYVPIVRTFAPVIAGVGEMQYKTFLSYNIAGGIVWCFSIGLAGYFLGTKVPNIDTYILPIVIGIFILSFIPVIREFFIKRKNKVKSG